jgi:hypothetical protein
VLMKGELVAMAYGTGPNPLTRFLGKSKSSRGDRVVFTNRRILLIDCQGRKEIKVEYKSIPYSSIRGFSVETAGHWDRTAEVWLGLKNHWTMARVELDFRNTCTDIMAIQKYMAFHIFGTYKGSKRNDDVPPTTWPTYESDVTGFLDFLGDDNHQIDAKDVEARLRVEPPILQEDEEVEAAFKCGRDMFLHTSKRLLYIDVQLSGQVSYTSCPLKYCTGFKIKTAGKLDRDAEMTASTRCML